MIKKLNFYVLIIALNFCISSIFAANTTKWPVYAYCGTGDNLWNHKVEPVDSPASIDAMFEWMSQTYKVKKMYWRGEQQEIWRTNYKLGSFDILVDDWTNWCNYLFKDIKINTAAVASAKRHGMEIFIYTGLFEHGIQPDVGVIAPHLFEDTLRIEHPEWCDLDRWGQRRCPGPISFCYPEVRKILVQRYVDNITKYGYDGINFYTYVENTGLTYEDEFGFNQPIVDEFNKRYPGVNLRKDTLTEEQQLHWYKCRGKFVTDFLTELHDKLAPQNKKLSIILDAAEPNYVQSWWSKPVRGTGKIYMDWENWINDGIVDEIWVQLAGVTDQKALLDRLLVKCAGKPVKLTVRSPDPLGSVWEPYVAKGVTPIAVITWEKNGIERVSLDATSLKTLKSLDWKLRAQTLSDIGQGKIAADVNDIASFIDDTNGLVRHRAVKALPVFKNDRAILLLEKSLTDTESSVRIAAADSLIKLQGHQTASQILNALEKDSYFQFKMVCVSALCVAGKDNLPILLKGLGNPNIGMREVFVRALSKLAKPDTNDEIYPVLRRIMLNPEETFSVRCLAISGLTGAYQAISEEKSDIRRNQLIKDLTSLVCSNSDIVVELHAIRALERLSKYMPPPQKKETLDIMAKLFRSYGDGCNRSDASYGWRVVGNAMDGLGSNGTDILESMRAQTEDKWLAWTAYEVLYLAQKSTTENSGFNLVDKKLAIENHEKYAPAFPGWRKW